MNDEQKLRQECLQKATEATLTENFGGDTDPDSIIVFANDMFEFIMKQKLPAD